jgi:hypothetical protein
VLCQQSEVTLVTRISADQQRTDAVRVSSDRRCHGTGLSISIMETPRVIAVEILNGGLLLAFDDQVCAFYPASLLRSSLDQSELIDEKQLIEE